MQANPSKFQAIAVGKRPHEKSPTFNFGSINITCNEVVKLLGIDIDFKLSFYNQISNISKIAVQQLNILERIGNRLSRLNKLSIFHTFILSNFNFCPLAWHFCSEGNTEKDEKKYKNELLYLYMKILAAPMKISYKKKTVYQVYTLEEWEQWPLRFLKFLMKWFHQF